MIKISEINSFMGIYPGYQSWVELKNGDTERAMDDSCYYEEMRAILHNGNF